MGFPGGTSGKEPAYQCRRHKETRVWSLGQEDPLEEGMVTYFSFLAWQNPINRGAWWAQFRPQLCLTLWPHVFPVYHQLLELAQYSCPPSRWCHPTISSSVVPFSSQLQSFPASGSFPMSQFFSSDGQSIGVSASTSVLPMNIQDWFPSGLVGSPFSPRDSQESSPTPQFKIIHSSVLSFPYSPTLTSIHDYWKNHSFD